MKEATEKTIEEAKAMAVAASDYRTLLNKECADGEIADRGGWLEAQARFAVCNLPHPTADRIAAAMQINFVGVPYAVRTVRNIVCISGIEDADHICYVEEGKVYMGIWIKGSKAEEAAVRADILKNQMETGGWIVGVRSEVEDDAEFTVMGEMDFEEYFTKYGKEVAA